MPSKKKAKAPKGLSPQEAAQANQQGFNHAMNSMPLLQFDDMMGNFSGFADSITDPFSELFNQIIGRGEQTTVWSRQPLSRRSIPRGRIQELMTTQE